MYFESNSGTPLAPGVSRLIRLPMYLFSFESSIQNGATDYGTTTGVKLVAYWHNTLTFTTWSDGFLSAEANAMVSEVVAVDEEVLTLSSSANKDEYQVTLYTATPKKNGRHVRLYAPVYTSNSMKSVNSALVDCEGSNVPAGGACSYQFAVLTNTVGFETCLADADHEFSTVPAGQDAYTNAGYCIQKWVLRSSGASKSNILDLDFWLSFAVDSGDEALGTGQTDFISVKWSIYDTRTLVDATGLLNLRLFFLL